MGPIYDIEARCASCVFKYNKILGKMIPCDCCLNGSEYVSATDDDTIVEYGWLNDPEMVNEVIDIIDDIHLRLEALDMLIPGSQIGKMTNDTYDYLTAIKKSLIDTYVQGVNIPGTPCYERLGETETCLDPPYEGYCQEKLCPF